jgi:hypothetical protein
MIFLTVKATILKLRMNRTTHQVFTLFRNAIRSRCPVDGLNDLFERHIHILMDYESYVGYGYDLIVEAIYTGSLDTVVYVCQLFEPPIVEHLHLADELAETASSAEEKSDYNDIRDFLFYTLERMDEDDEPDEPASEPEGEPEPERLYYISEPYFVQAGCAPAA